MTGLFTGMTLLLWSLQLLAIATISNTLLGIVALITALLWIVSSAGVALPALPTRRNQ